MSRIRLLTLSTRLEFNYPDMGVFDEVVAGIVLTGEAKKRGLFNPKRRPATATVEQTKAQACKLRAEVLSRVTT